jgi:hypothetical protein
MRRLTPKAAFAPAGASAFVPTESRGEATTASTVAPAAFSSNCVFAGSPPARVPPRRPHAQPHPAPPKLTPPPTRKNLSFSVTKSFAVFALLLAALAETSSARGWHFAFDFSESDHGFVAGFADLPADFEPALYNLVADRRSLPANLGGAPALFIGGSNRSDDLFMFWKKRITGLPPNTTVRLTMELEFASKYAEGLVGIGGAPGEGVTVKAGAVPFEPSTLPDRENWLRINLDKGNQSLDGANMSAIGDVAKPEDGNENDIILTRGQHGTPLTATTASDGSLWLIFGTDSGFEGRTELYHTRFSLWIDTPQQPALWIEPATQPGNIRLIWNTPGLLQSTTDLALTPWTDEIFVTRPPTQSTTGTAKRFWRLAPLKPPTP